MTEDARRLSPAQRSARLTLCRKALEDGTPLARVARQAGIHPWTLRRYLKRHVPRLANNRRREPKLSPQVHKSRLNMVLTFGKPLAAELLGISPAALYDWCSLHAPDGPRAALEKLASTV